MTIRHGVSIDAVITQRSTVGSTVDAGQFVPPRDQTLSNNVGMASGTVVFTYFYADHTETITTLTAFSGATAAAATPTVCRMGLCSVAANGDLTPIGSTPNDTTLFAAINTAYPKAMSASVGLTKGNLYCTMVIVVTGTTMPTFHGIQYAATNPMNTIVRISPAFIGRLAGQTDLPAAPVSAASLIGIQFSMTVQLS